MYINLGLNENVRVFVILTYNPHDAVLYTTFEKAKILLEIVFSHGNITERNNRSLFSFCNEIHSRRVHLYYTSLSHAVLNVDKFHPLLRKTNMQRECEIAG